MNDIIKLLLESNFKSYIFIFCLASYVQDKIISSLTLLVKLHKKFKPSISDITTLAILVYR